MKGTYDQLLRALTPLGEVKVCGSQLKFNCPRCENELKNPIDKFNLEINFQKNAGKCWACGLSGSLYSFISQYGYKDFAPLFKSENKVNYEETKEKKVSLPLELSNVCNFPEVNTYLKKRGLTSEFIKEREIKYCFDGYFKNNIVFPSYNTKGELVAIVMQNFYTKQYRKFLSSDFVCFYENFINKNSLIIMTEGVFDGGVIPNSLILLGTEINDKILDFLIDADVLLILDADVNKDLIEKKVNQLKSTCKSVQYLILTPEQDDVNFFFTKNPNLLKSKLLPYYLPEVLI